MKIPDLIVDLIMEYFNHLYTDIDRLDIWSNYRMIKSYVYCIEQ